MNDLAQSASLTAAANEIVQNAEMVGAGLRTISMRLTGSSVEEIAAAGEDVEGMVETTSKLKKVIEQLTAVNGKAGISILDMNGNFKSTYEIMTEIANRWEEIQAADKKDGTNRANALLEQLAG